MAFNPDFAGDTHSATSERRERRRQEDKKRMAYRRAIELEPRRLLDLVQRRRHAALELLVELGQGGGVHACAVVGTVVR